MVRRLVRPLSVLFLTERACLGLAWLKEKQLAFSTPLGGATRSLAHHQSRPHCSVWTAKPRVASSVIMMAVTKARGTGVDIRSALNTGTGAFLINGERGKLDVSVKFKVPSKEPWPESLWGFDLGPFVKSVRLNKEELRAADPEYIKKLDDLGFGWGQRGRSEGNRSVEWEQVALGIELYKSKFGDANVPSRFAVPENDEWPAQLWSLKLGQKVAAIRSTGRYINNKPERKQQLDDLGFQWGRKGTDITEADCEPFEDILDSLQVYKQIHGDFNIPTTYKVPEEPPWPERLYSIPLGARIITMREHGLYTDAQPERQQMLQDIGFDFTGQNLATETKFRKIYDALRFYAELYGQVDVPQDYVVPSEDEVWPMDFWDMKLGQRVNSIRKSGTFVKNHPSRRRLLDELGFLWEAPSKTAGKEAARDLMAADARDPAAAADAQSLLDSLVASIKDDPRIQATLRPASAGDDRSGGTQPPIPPAQPSPQARAKELLEEVPYYPLPGEEDETADWPTNIGVHEARKALSKLGDVAMGGGGQISGKIAPVSDSLRPNAMPLSAGQSSEPGLSLGSDGVFAVTKKSTGRRIPRGVNTASMMWMTDEERDMVGKYGFDWDEFGDFFTFEHVLEALEHYKKLFGSLSMEPEFKVPYDYEWSRDLADMRLGMICEQMRCGDIFAKDDEERRSRLDALGFDWGDGSDYLYFQYDQVLCGLYAHKMIRGDVYVPADWVVPDVDPWPLPLRGMPLGFLVNCVRWQRDLLQEKYLDRYLMLDGLGMLWCDPIFVDWKDIEVKGVCDQVLDDEGELAKIAASK
ncbi:unnamed protein product [Chrysoparadoxa australica]